MKNKNSKAKNTFAIKELKGFRLRSNGKIEAHKMVNGKRYWAHFSRESDAYYWKKNFHPILNPNPERPLPNVIGQEGLGDMRLLSVQRESLNGTNQMATFSDVWANYWNNHLLTKELHTQHNNKRACENFYGPLMNLKICQINRSVISRVLLQKKEEVISCKRKISQRLNFNNELKKLSTLFNWYIKNFDETYRNPVCSLHLSEGFLKRPRLKKKKLTADEVLRFFHALEKQSKGQLWRDLAETQFYMAARIQEAGGLLWHNVHFDKNEIELCEVAVYIGKDFVRTKVGTKNGESRIIKMNERLKEILLRRYKERALNCPYVFHLKGKAINKQVIDRHYNKGFADAQLPYFSGTHVLRHTMANLIREHLSLDHAKAVGGWKSSRVVETIYTNTPTKLSTESLCLIENVLGEKESDEKRGKNAHSSVANCG